jgi:tripartite-type tricarboxylate transporter receptor subunit TctC
MTGVILPLAGHAEGQWPERPVRLVVPYAPGGNTDAVARITGQYLQQALGNAATFVIENRGGAGGIVGTAVVAKAPPDGYTLCVCGIGAITIASAAERLPYDPLTDLAPISVLNTNPEVLVVNPSSSAHSVADLVAVARTQPGRLTYGSSGVGGLMHFSAVIFADRYGIELTHVPYRGGAPATAALLANEVSMVFANMSDALPLVRAGNLRALAITTRERSSSLLDVPTIAETGLPGYAAESWNGLFAPSGTPQSIIDRLSVLSIAMARDTEVQRRMAALGSISVANTPEDFARQLQEETSTWDRILRRMNLGRQ